MSIMHSTQWYFALSTPCETDVRKTSYPIVRSCDDKNEQIDADGDQREDFHVALAEYTACYFSET